MPFEKGRKKTGGRRKGSVNKKNTPLAVTLTEFISGNWNVFTDCFQELEAKDKMDVMIKLLPYVMAKKKAVEMVDHRAEQKERQSFQIGDQVIYFD